MEKTDIKVEHKSSDHTYDDKSEKTYDDTYKKPYNKLNEKKSYNSETTNNSSMPSSQYKKFNTEYCNNDMTFEECELAILRHAVDENEEVRGKKEVHSEEVQEIISIVEKFISSHGLICYGGTAINNILPEDSQFYNKDVEIPDYDFYSKDAMNHARELADIYAAKGFREVEAKSGIHTGTYKVFVNAIGVADITQIHPDLFDSFDNEKVTIKGINYAPPNFLRMSMYLELSRPEGDLSRWEKVFKRLTLLNKHYPLYNDNLDKKCQSIDFQRPYKHYVKKTKSLNQGYKSKEEELYYLIRDEFISQKLVFVGGYAASLYTKYMDKEHQRYIREIPDFDVLSEDPEKSANLAKEKLILNGYQNIKLVKHTSIGEVIPESIQILVDKETVAVIYRPLSCHNYNEIHPRNITVHIATIDTLLSFYLAFLYANKSYFNKERILCMAAYLFKVEEKNRLEQTGLLKRFSMSCYGKQETLGMMREKKSAIYKKYKDNQNSKEYQENFFKYNPNYENNKHKQNFNPSKRDESEKHFSESKTINTEDTSKKNSIDLNKDDEENATMQSIEDTFKSSPEEKNESKFQEKKNKVNGINNKKYSYKTPYKFFNKSNKKSVGKTKKIFNFSKIGKFLWK